MKLIKFIKDIYCYVVNINRFIEAKSAMLDDIVYFAHTHEEPADIQDYIITRHSEYCRNFPEDSFIYKPDYETNEDWKLRYE